MADNSPSLHVLRDSNPDAFARLVEQLRNAASAYAESEGLRQAARDIGMSPTGLQNFILGNTPRLTTVHKLHGWWVGELRKQGPSNGKT